MIKKAVTIFSIILLVGCGKDSGNSNGEAGNTNDKVCGLSVLSHKQIEDVIVDLQLEYNNNAIGGDGFENIAASLTFKILRLQPDFDILSSISGGEIYEFVQRIFVEESESIKDLIAIDIEQIKNCNWEK